MKISVINCNIILFLFTCLVLATDGLPTETIYIVFTLWTFLTLILNTVVISRILAGNFLLGLNKKEKVLEGSKQTDEPSYTDTTIRIMAIICNFIFLGFHGWAFVDQYPHPEENGFIVFVVLIVLTPILSLVVLISSGMNEGWLNLNLKGKGLTEEKNIDGSI
jgi:hypothetical protein